MRKIPGGWSRRSPSGCSPMAAGFPLMLHAFEGNMVGVSASLPRRRSIAPCPPPLPPGLAVTGARGVPWPDGHLPFVPYRSFRTLSICEALRIARAAKLGSVRAASAKYWRRAGEVVGIIVGSGRRTVIAAPSGARLPEFARATVQARPRATAWAREYRRPVPGEMKIVAQVFNSTYGKPAVGVRAKLAQPSENGWVRSLNPKLICEVHETGVLCHRKYFTVRV
jgi:hypothetical protein